MLGTQQRLGTPGRGGHTYSDRYAGSFVGAVLYAVLESMTGPRAQRAPQAPPFAETLRA